MEKTKLEEEIKNTTVTIEKLEEGLELNKIVLAAFQVELEKYNA